ncbi:cytochrome P450 [Calycina marina]|uniref:Cytochrome P450 n=1 Tax=Calycina marina TaxID=1763456 RepID=A0A9P7Z736_9HELO|nr:cytochrome P450 [Calycina marina]
MSSVWELLYQIQSPVWLSITLILIVVAPITHFIARRRRLNFPVVDFNRFKDDREAIITSTLEHPNTPFILPFPAPLVVLPISTLEEVRNLPENQVSFIQEIKRMFSYKHTGIGITNPALNRTIKVDLTRHIAEALDAMQDEIRFSFDKQLGECNDWKKVNLYRTLTRVIALLSGRVFVGLPTSRDEEWLDATILYSRDCELARQAIEKLPVAIRGFGARFLPAIRRLKKNQRRGAEILQPILDQCMATANSEKTRQTGAENCQGTFFTWFLKELGNPTTVNTEDMYKYQMALAFAAIHTTSGTSFQAILDLVARPQYIQPLRDEIDRIFQEDGHDQDEDGFPKLKKSSMPKLKKLDSFLKESQRLSPLGLLNLLRITTAPLTLSTGHTLPTGTRIAFPVYPVHMSTATPTYDPALNPSSTLPPDEFDGFRFEQLRTVSGQENKHQFVTTSPDSLNFGHGIHACPGRFFASNEIKVVLIELLRSWEFRMVGDVEGKGGERPVDIVSHMSVIPDVGVEIEVRRRKA